MRTRDQAGHLTIRADNGIGHDNFAAGQSNEGGVEADLFDLGAEANDNAATHGLGEKHDKVVVSMNDPASK